MRLFSFFFLLTVQILFSQSNGSFWDNMRATNETFTLKSGERKIIKTADFPEGTLEAVYRITVLDDNQKVSNSLVSVLKSIPDPTGISQGAAGGVFLLSTISGEDKCKYAVFRSLADAENFVKTGKKDKACLFQDTPVNKEIRRMSDKSPCMEKIPQNLYFVFESDNWILKEKIAFEVVPWVNIKLSSGWNSRTKTQLLDNISKWFLWAKNLTKKEQFQVLLMEKIEKAYNYHEFLVLIPAEKKKVIELFAEQSLKETGEIEKYYNVIRDQSLLLFKAGKTNEAIDLINVEMIGKNRASYKDYGVLGDYHLLTKQFSKAENYYNKGLEMNPSEIIFRLNLAHVYLFTNRFSKAKEIHKKYCKENLTPLRSWAEETKSDFAEFERRGFPTKDFKKILRTIE